MQGLSFDVISLVNTDVREVVRGSGHGWNAQATPTPVPQFQPQFQEHNLAVQLQQVPLDTAGAGVSPVSSDTGANAATTERSLEEHYRLFPHARPSHTLARSRRNIDLESLGPVDLVFVIDGSGSIGFANFERSLEIAARIVEELPIGPDNFM